MFSQMPPEEYVCIICTCGGGGESVCVREVFVGVRVWCVCVCECLRVYVQCVMQVSIIEVGGIVSTVHSNRMTP